MQCLNNMCQKNKKQIIFVFQDKKGNNKEEHINAYISANTEAQNDICTSKWCANAIQKELARKKLIQNEIEKKQHNK